MKKIIYITGDGRSGSTLLELVLANDSHTVSIGEGYRFWNRFYEGESNCSCDEKITNCPLWKAVHDQLNTIQGYNHQEVWQQIQFLLKFKNRNHIKDLLKTNDYAVFVQVVKCFYEALFSFTNSALIIDSSKSTGWLRILYELDVFELEIIHLERNLEAVANSWRKVVTLPEYKDRIVYMPVKSHYTIIKNWIKIKYSLRYLRGKENYHFWRYEKFILNPVGHLESLRPRLDLSLNWDKLIYPVTHGIGGNPMKGSKESTLQIRKSHPKLNKLSYFHMQLLKLIGRMAKIV